jgi:hypothetical protein
MAKIDLEKRLLLGITGKEENDWREKLIDINKLGLAEAALFLEWFDQVQRKKIYRALLDSSLENIPLCHIKNDMEIEELVFLETKFKTKYFTIHENSFSFLDKWPGFEKKLYLEMNVDDSISNKVSVERIGGFCVDLAHFQIAAKNRIKEFEYVYYRKPADGEARTKLFACNHLNGYDAKKNLDKHTIESVKDFDYLKKLPKFLFSKVIALETENSIEEQLEFKKYLTPLLDKVINN